MNRQSAARPPQDYRVVSEAEKEQIRKALGGDGRQLVEFARAKGEELAGKTGGGESKGALSTSQLRSVLDDIQRMTAYDGYKLQLLRPRLAYAACRHGDAVKRFQDIIEAAIEMTSAENFQRFKDLVEAIVGYHRYFGGK